MTKNCINDEEKIDTTLKGNEIIKSASTKIVKISHQDEDCQSIKVKQNVVQDHTKILLPQLNFMPTPSIKLTSNIKNYTRKLRLSEVF